MFTRPGNYNFYRAYSFPTLSLEGHPHGAPMTLGPQWPERQVADELPELPELPTCYGRLIFIYIYRDMNGYHIL
jgi:hypothetical protein